MPAATSVEGTLYTYPNNPRAQLIEISAQYGGSKVNVASEFEMGVTNQSADFLSKFPFGQVPAFESGAVCLNDTMAIASFVGGEALRGDNEASRAQITQYVNIAENKLFPSACQVLYPCWGLMPNNKGLVTKGKENLEAFMSKLDKVLEPRTYLVGESVTLADITMAIYMKDLYSMIFDEAYRNKFVNVTRWFMTITNQDEVTRVVGQTSLCVKPSQFDPKLFAENNPKQKKDAPKKAAAPKADQPKKEEKKDEPAKPAKKVVPFSTLEPAKLNLDDWKKCYWNETSEACKALFDEKFVQGEWTLWKTVYKYNHELKKTYMTNNLVKGLMQRLESMKKYAFGLMYVFGEDGDQCIAGVWMGRGPNVVFEVEDSWNIDIEHYTVTKLDVNSKEDKATWWKFIDGEMDDYEGKPFQQDHIF